MTEPTTLPGITVIGQRPVFGIMTVPTTGGDDNIHQQEVTPEDGTSSGGGGLATPEQVAEEEKRQKDCASAKYKQKLLEKPDRNSKEYFSLTFVRDGQIATTDLRGGGAQISGPQIAAAMSEFGIGMGDVLGLNHNHPRNEYCDAADSYTRNLQTTANAYPSDNDWNAADAFVNGGADPNFSLYVAGCDGEVREFPYSGRNGYRQDRNAGRTPPPPVQPEGCPEG